MNIGLYVDGHMVYDVVHTKSFIVGFISRILQHWIGTLIYSGDGATKEKISNLTNCFSTFVEQ